jgi:predicted O-methyltransferase YrrM
MSDTPHAAWAAVDDYFAAHLAPADPALDAALAANTAAGLPPHDVSPLQGQLLALFVRLTGARRVLEFGTLGGYSTIWMARALAPGGRVVTLEADPAHAAVARANLARAGVADRVGLHVGPALDTLPEVERAAAGSPFDLVFIDADKPNNPAYLAWALRLGRVGTLIVGDNVVREGGVVDSASADARVHGVRQFVEDLGRERAAGRLIATAVQTVGSKGWDGFTLAVVTAREDAPTAD